MRGIIIVPCFNEDRSIRALVRSFHEYAPSLDVLVIDDGSTDRTRIEAEASGAQVVSLPINLGIGGAVQTGIKYAVLNGYDYAIQVDGDGQHPPSEISKLVAKFCSTGADLVIGSRFLSSADNFRSTFLRRIGILLIRSAILAATKLKIADPTSGFRLMGREVLGLFAREYPTDFPEAVSIVMVHRARLRHVEISVAMRPREFGMSSINGFDSVFFMLRVVISIILQKHVSGGRQNAIR